MVQVVTLAIELITVLALVVLVLMGYYAAKILGRLKGGLLQEGWKWITAAAFMILIAQCILVANYAFGLTPQQAQYTTLYAYCIKIVAGALFLQGFRAQYKIWRLKNKQKEEDEPRVE